MDQSLEIFFFILLLSLFKEVLHKVISSPLKSLDDDDDDNNNS